MIAVALGSVEDAFEFLCRKVVGRCLIHPDCANAEHGVLADPFAALTKVEETHHAALLLALGQRLVLPARAKIAERKHVQISQTGIAPAGRPTEKLFAKNGLEFGESGFPETPILGILQIRVYGIGDRD